MDNTRGGWVGAEYTFRNVIKLQMFGLLNTHLKQHDYEIL